MTEPKPARHRVRIKRVPAEPGCEHTPVPLPRYQNPGDAGMDLSANLPGKNIVIMPGQVSKIGTGFIFALPTGFVGLVCSRSGMAADRRVSVVNSPGVVDAQFRDEVVVALLNSSNAPYTVLHGDRIAQMLILAAPQFDLDEVTSLEDTQRGTGGFGSTGYS